VNGLSETERIVKEILSLPIYPELNEIDVIVEAVKEFEKKVG
jgi:dTDP-4-amino-4,6-dideoxygalactose transaminase